LFFDIKKENSEEKDTQPIEIWFGFALLSAMNAHSG
jgi:hypothetical protein